MGISSKTLAEHFFCLVQTLLCPTQLAELDVSKRAVWRDQEQLIQVRFRGQGIVLIHSSCCMIQIALCGARRDCLELISDGFELSPVSVLQSIGAKRAPRFRKVGTQSCRFAPLAVSLLSAALLLECDTQLVMPHGILGGVLERLLKRLNAFIHFPLPELNLPLQDQRLRILRCFL